jgi:hypothetical protein
MFSSRGPAQSPWLLRLLLVLVLGLGTLQATRLFWTVEDSEPSLIRKPCPQPPLVSAEASGQPQPRDLEAPVPPPPPPPLSDPTLLYTGDQEQVCIAFIHPRVGLCAYPSPRL